MFLQDKTVKSPSREIVKLSIWSNRCYVKLLKWDRIIPMREEEESMEVVVMEIMVAAVVDIHNNNTNNREDTHPKVLVGMVVTNNHLHNNTTSNNLLMVNSSTNLMVDNHPMVKLRHLMVKHLHHPNSTLHNNILISSRLPTVTLRNNRYLLLLRHLPGKQPLLAMDKCITTTKFQERHNGKNQLECCKKQGKTLSARSLA
mmetsp:Transcript_2761/g.4021  ORF Transcript_2761/g.4021 Transcript_2761/m.4021 type:complete len:201 (+) Transcript_2761:1582-2184(+)